MKSVNVVVGVIKNSLGQYILTRRHEPNKKFHGFWHLPGGGVEPKETYEKAIIREIREELGLDVSVICPIPGSFSQVRKKSCWKGIFHPFLLEVINGKQNIQLDAETSKFEWIYLHDIKKYKCLALTEEILKESLKTMHPK